MTPSQARRVVVNQRRRARDAVKSALIEEASLLGVNIDIDQLRGESPDRVQAALSSVLPAASFAGHSLTAHVNREQAASSLAERYEHERGDVRVLASDIIDAVIDADGDVIRAMHVFAGRDWVSGANQQELMSVMATAAAMTGLDARAGGTSLQAEPVRRDDEGRLTPTVVAAATARVRGAGVADGEAEAIVDALVEHERVETVLAMNPDWDPDVIIVASSALGLTRTYYVVDDAERRRARRRVVYAQNSEAINARRRERRREQRERREQRAQRYLPIAA